MLTAEVYGKDVDNWWAAQSTPPDAQIAVTAIEHGLTIVTRNHRDFEDLGVPILNPWER